MNGNLNLLRLYVECGVSLLGIFRGSRHKEVVAKL